MKQTTFFFLLFLLFSCNEPVMETPTVEPEITNPEPEIPEGDLTYLALGDSYTIGQSVDLEERFPMQLKTLLNDAGVEIAQPDFVAGTGWTTSDLQVEIDARTDLLEKYSIVTLLIGVNNEYQSQPIEDYETEFPQLLNKAIEFAGGNKNRVFVVSIPDYAFTPFGRGREDISKGIDEYNAINRKITEEAGITYFDITPISREGLDKPELVANDNLHPSGEQYRRWADVMFENVKMALE